MDTMPKAQAVAVLWRLIEERGERLARWQTAPPKDEWEERAQAETRLESGAIAMAAEAMFNQR